MADSQNTVLITGVAGNLGLRLLQQLADFRIVGVDLAPPAASELWRFESLDLGEESSCDALVRLTAKYPSLALPIARRRHGVPVGPSTEVVIEGFPRSGTSFAVAAFRIAQRRPVEIARPRNVRPRRRGDHSQQGGSDLSREEASGQRLDQKGRCNGRRTRHLAPT